jgi:hypothetical protein
MLFSWISIFKFCVTQEIREIREIHENKNAKINKGSLQFVEITNIGANEQKYFHIM